MLKGLREFLFRGDVVGLKVSIQPGKTTKRAGEFNNSMQAMQLNPGEYTVKILPVGSDQGHEEQIKIEADKVTIVRSAK